MKRSLIFIICSVILIMSAISISALETEEPVLTMGKDAESQAILDAFSEYIEQNSKMTEYEDGTLVFEFTPCASNITIEEIPERTDVINVGAQPQYFTHFPDYSYTTGQAHTSVSREQNYLYSLFNDEYKARYRSIEQSAKGFAEKTEYFQANDYQEILTLYRSFLFDNPEYFYISVACTLYTGDNEYAIGFIYSIGNRLGDSAGYGYGQMTESLKSRINAKKAVFDQTVSNLISTIPANAPDFVKERLIYSKILRSSFYNLDAVNNNLWDGLANDNWTAYGILVNGMGVCESYAEAFQTVCKAVGIPCTGVIGDAGGGHKWNAVQIGGQWYQCDITFDDPIGNEANDTYSFYFNLTDVEMSNLNHDWSTCDFPVPPCNTTEFGQKNFFSLFEEDDEGTLHFFANKCNAKCQNCNYTRYESDHIYESNNICIYCGNDRTQKNGWFEENNNNYYYENGIKVTNDWRYNSGELCYLDDQGKMAYDVFAYHNDRLAYVDENGHLATSINGWINYRGSRYFLENGYRVENRWVVDSFGYCYLDSIGLQVKNTFIVDSNGLAYIGEDGYWNGNFSGIVYISDEMFYVKNGYKATYGWITIDNVEYFLTDGMIATNIWIFEDYGVFYLGEDGQKVSNCFVEDLNGLAYIDKNGYFSSEFSGTVYINDETFYVQNGYKVTDGWITLDNVEYFLIDGRIAKNQWIVDSFGKCYLDENGQKLSRTFVKDSNGWAYIEIDGYFYPSVSTWIYLQDSWYLIENGYRVESRWVADSCGRCYLNENGKQVSNTFIADSIGLAYIGENGYFSSNFSGTVYINGELFYVQNGYKVTDGWVNINGSWFFLEDGKTVKNQWIEDANGRCYVDEKGYRVTDSWIKDGDKWAYINEYGLFLDYTGWINRSGNRYYLKNGYRLENSWAPDSYGNRYVNENGETVKDTFINDVNGLAYIESDGYFKYRTGWLFFNNKWYFLENGYAVMNNWRLDSKGWCYLGEDGAMLTDEWMQDSTGWCYLDSSGYWDGVYHKSNHFEKNGWQQEGDNWYYYEDDEKVTSSWREDSTGWCFLDEEGKWVLDAFVKDSFGWAYITADGYFYYDTNGWIDYYGTWYYIENGYAVTNQWRADSQGWCYLSENGAMVTNNFVNDSTGSAYITEDGYFYYNVTGWKLVNDEWYYVENGYAVTNTWREDSQGWCFLSETGAMVVNDWVKDSTGWCWLDESGYWDGIYYDQIPA